MTVEMLIRKWDSPETIRQKRQDWTYEPLCPETVWHSNEMPKSYACFLESCMKVWPEEPVTRTHYELDYTYVFNRLGDVAGKCILDVGTGEGRLAVHLALQGAKVYALDCRDYGYRFVEARKHGADVAWIHCDVEEHVLRPIFDTVISVSALEHLDYEKAHRCFTVIPRCLKPGGHMIGTLLWSPLGAYFGDAHGYSPADFARVVYETGFLPCPIVAPSEKYWYAAWENYKKTYPGYSYLPTGFDIFVSVTKPMRKSPAWSRDGEIEKEE